MKISKTEAGYTVGPDAGRFSFIIEPSMYGAYVAPEELAKQAACFDSVVITGKYSDIFGQIESLNKLIKKTITDNANVVFRIFTNADGKPVGFKTSENIKYYIFINLKSSQIPYEQRVRANALLWFIQSGAYITFNISETDEFDEASMIMKDVGIPSKNVFFIYVDIFNKLEYRDFYKTAKMCGYNIVGGCVK